MNYYEINFYGEGHKNDWSYYIQTPRPMTREELTEELQDNFIGVDGLEQHHLDNIDSISIITAKEFTECSGVPLIIPQTKSMIYDEMCRVLTDYENDESSTDELYAMLVKIQNNWEDVITAD